MGALEAVAETGDRLATLKELRSTLAASIESAPAGAVATLTKQFLEVLAQIEALTPVDMKDTPLDELEKRRSKREANPTSAVATSRGRKRGG